MRWNAATGAIARCKATSSACARKRRFVCAWRWTCGVKPKPKAVNRPSKHYMMRVQATHNPVSLLQCLFEALQLGLIRPCHPLFALGLPAGLQLPAFAPLMQRRVRDA
jgi:hypothetical protein